MLKFWERWDTTELNTHYDSCDLADQALLIVDICQYKGVNGTDLSTTHAISPLDRYTISMLQTQYDACALTDALKDEICFLKDYLMSSLDQVMTEPKIKNYPQTIVEAAYACLKIMTGDDERRICLLKSRGCESAGCAFSASQYDDYKSNFGEANVKAVYDGCSKKDEMRYL